MPAKRRTASAASTSKNSDSPLSPRSDDPAYQEKRKKNNEAVQRTREKTKKSAEERKKRIDELRKQNDALKVQIEQGEKHISTLRDLIIQGEKTEDGHRIIQEILAGPDPDDND
ncbi:CCAAT/enhancer-binding protein homolog 2 [Drosophila suzukii]|uniref:CCAAT/enhancer-binding protein homolog 2 n=1 Tax=Drosophila suzukii TaxID=28584 RepID=A0AB39ZI57_DROSZ|nr:CCAAT/enhancer-binding protein gamma [Drosophila suzukii]